MTRQRDKAEMSLDVTIVVLKRKEDESRRAAVLKGD